MAKKKAAKKSVKKAAKAAAAPKAKKAAKPKAAPAAKKAAAKPKAAKKAAKQAARATSPASSERVQAERYAAGVEAFQAGKTKRAIELFTTVAEGPDASLRHRANVHLQICRRRSESDRVELATVDDFYNYAVKLINDRRLDEADQYLDKAVKKAARAGYVHYAKAIVAALRVDKDNAYRSLNRAIELDDRHRLQARRDPDMAPVRDDARIVELIEGNASAGDA